MTARSAMDQAYSQLELNYKKYMALCEGCGFKPCDFVSWQMYSVFLDEHHFPYLTGYGAVWVHDARKKTKRTDRPLGVRIWDELKRQ